MAPRTILVVGSNKGIGFAIIQRLALYSPDDHLLLGVRDLGRGNDAVTKLRDGGVTSRLDTVCIDITSDESIRAAEEDVRRRFGKLDVLVNNAAIAVPETIDALRESYAKVFDMNVASVMYTTEIFLPLLKETSPDPRVIQVSSARGSMARIAQGVMPPARTLSYGASKAALNLVTLELSRRKGNEAVSFQCTSPGHCKTDFNHNTGLKDPFEGARVVVDLILEPKGRPCGLWEIEGDDVKPTLVPW